MPKRSRPLTAPDALAAPEDDHADRTARFDAGVRALRVGNVRSVLNERLLLVLGGVLAPLGLLAVLVGWYGASQTPYLFEQVPYLISGGLFGLGLVFLGGFLYFAHWLTELLREQRAQSAALLDAVESLRAELAAERQASTLPSANGAAPGARRRAAR